jgi:polypeptide N-acetylgalactosaminyltransferase
VCSPRGNCSVVLQVGGFTWSGHFTWVVVPEAELARRGSPVAPTRYVAHVGAVFQGD